MRVLATLALIVVTSIGCGWLRQYEYEEDVYLSLDGTATVYVNSSVAALDALRGASFDASPNVPVDRDAVLSYFASALTHVRPVSTSRHSGRRFVHVRLDVDDVRRLSETVPFAWSRYRFEREGDLYLYQQTIGPSAQKDVGHVGWTGRELVAFRLHVPSKIAYHNTLPANVRRGNILVWEQSLDDRLRGVPLTLDARMQAQSILYRTLWLFGATFVSVAITFGLVIWWVVRRGGEQPAHASSR